RVIRDDRADDHGNVRRGWLATKRLENLPTVVSGHQDVKDHQFRPKVPGQAKSAVRRTSLNQLVFGVGEVPTKQQRHVGVIVDQQESRGVSHWKREAYGVDVGKRLAPKRRAQTLRQARADLNRGGPYARLRIANLKGFAARRGRAAVIGH